MTKNHLFLFILLFPLFVWGQEDICIGKKYSLFSQTLNQEREYWVYLPNSYSESEQKNYPVIYLLDASTFFHSLVGIERAYSQSRIPIMPECIIVGVISGNDRALDFTPTKTTFQRDGSSLPADKAQGGGSEKFTTFVGEELRNKINSTYRTNGQNMLIGHSYSALFTICTLLYHSNLFAAYIAFDPSLWWDNNYVVKQAETIFKQKNMSGKSLYIAYGGKLRANQKTLNPTSTSAFFKTLDNAKQNGLEVVDEAFPDDNHGSIFTSAIGKALKAVSISDK